MKPFRATIVGLGMKRKHAIVGIALLGLVVGSGPVFAAGSPAATLSGRSAVRLATLAPRVPSGSARLGSVPSSQPITITIALRPSHTDRLSALLHDLYDPTSSRYEQWLAPGEFNREFGPSRAQIEAVTSWLHGKGLNDTSVDGSAIQARGQARDIAAGARGLVLALPAPRTVHRVRRIRGAAGPAKHRR